MGCLGAARSLIESILHVRVESSACQCECVFRRARARVSGFCLGVLMLLCWCVNGNFFQLASVSNSIEFIRVCCVWVYVLYICVVRSRTDVNRCAAGVQKFPERACMFSSYIGANGQAGGLGKLY